MGKCELHYGGFKTLVWEVLYTWSFLSGYGYTSLKPTKSSACAKISSDTEFLPGKPRLLCDPFIHLILNRCHYAIHSRERILASIKWWATQHIVSGVLYTNCLLSSLLPCNILTHVIIRKLRHRKAGWQKLHSQSGIDSWLGDSSWILRCFRKCHSFLRYFAVL